MDKNLVDTFVCPGCGRDIRRVALVDLVIKPTECRCDAEPYPHIENAHWHEECFVKSRKTKPAPAQGQG